MSVTLPTLAVSVIFCLSEMCRRAHVRRECLLHQRVAYLLWTMAQLDD